MIHLPVSIAAGLETAINRYVHLDPEAQDLFDALDGKVIRIELTDLNLCYYLLPIEQRINVMGRCEHAPDTTLRGTSIAMVRMRASEDTGGPLFSGEVLISGDVKLGQQFQAAIDAIDIDWEEQLSRITGDAVAHKVGNLVRGAVKWGQQTIDTLGKDVAEYLHEESRVLPAQYEVEEFIAAVDKLRADVDRAQARLNRLNSLLPTKPTKRQTSKKRVKKKKAADQ